MAGAHAERYIVKSGLSEVRFLVFKAGPLAALGHNHVVQAKALTGEIYLNRDFRQSQFSLNIPVADLLVDDALARAEEGAEFAKPPDVAAIAGTTKNMRGDKVLHAALLPDISIRSIGLDGTLEATDVSIRIKLRNIERDFTFPVSIECGNGKITASAQFEIKQTDLGVTPLSILGGAIQVANTLRVRMHIVAQKG